MEKKIDQKESKKGKKKKNSRPCRKVFRKKNSDIILKQLSL